MRTLKILGRLGGVETDTAVAAIHVTSFGDGFVLDWIDSISFSSSSSSGSNA
jgi:hypothetical protein